MVSTNDRNVCEPAANVEAASGCSRSRADEAQIAKERGCPGKGKFQHRDFRFDVLTCSSTFSAEGSLFARLGKHDSFMPTKTCPPMTVNELAALEGD